MHQELESLVTPVFKLSRDMIKGLRQSGGGITDSEARFLVDLYYTMQDQRVRVNNQVKGLDRDAQKSDTTPEPHETLDWVLQQFSTLESQVAKLLQVYTETHKMAWFFDQTIGIGPILSAGLLAHIDIRQAPTVGHIWNFAGLNPDMNWCSREKAQALWNAASGNTIDEKLASVARTTGRRYESLYHMATHKPDGSETALTAKGCISAISKRPWNAELKKLCWKIGDSFVKQSSNPRDTYGKVYRNRKAFEWDRNLSGVNTETAASILVEKSFGKDTDARAWLSGQCDPEKARALLEEGKAPTASACKSENGTPMLPPAQIDMRARRYAVKLFLSHLHECWYQEEHGEAPPKPFAIAMKGHAHYIAPPQSKPSVLN